VYNHRKFKKRKRKTLLWQTAIRRDNGPPCK